tara:strand:- start:294 stop:467 length:174 start_codon:yes stop_codon:yes gene_type:complete
MKSQPERMSKDQIHNQRDRISSRWSDRERNRRANIAALRQKWILDLILPCEAKQRCV